MVLDQLWHLQYISLVGKGLKTVISEIYQMFTKEEYMLAIVLLFLFKIMVYLLRNHFVVSFYFI